MARFARLDVLNAMLDTGLVPLFYHADLETAISIASACAIGGASVVEFTNRGERALEVFTALVRHLEETEPALILGIGSVIDVHTAAMYLVSGANFIVGPTLDPEIARLCNRRKVAYIPGCATATELSQADELGVEICKVFPAAQLGGPSFIKAQLAPCPWRRLMPTGGLDATEEDVKGWIKAGAAALGLSSKLITRELVAARDFEGIARKVAQLITWIREERANADG
jgi:2-dehydro-3-deoxyphosphogluconate aldolase/(4S)-4-hydroxy-2-oxoglutarate aldolase